MEVVEVEMEEDPFELESSEEAEVGEDEEATVEAAEEDGMTRVEGTRVGCVDDRRLKGSLA